MGLCVSKPSVSGSPEHYATHATEQVTPSESSSPSRRESPSSSISALRDASPPPRRRSACPEPQGSPSWQWAGWSGHEGSSGWSEYQGNLHDSAHEWQGVFSTDRKQLGAYLLARYLDGREVSESHAQSLAEASETLKDTRDTLSFGRGNVDADLELTQGESGQRVAASRVVSQRLKESGATLGTSHTVAMAELVKAGLCSEHGDVAVHRHIPKLKTGEQIHKIAAPRSDHGWAELRRPGSPKENAIVIDPWAEGGPILAEDGSYTHPHISDDARVSRYAYGPALGRRALASLEKSRAQLSNIAASVERARSELSDNGYWPESERIWSPEPVIESGFAQRVQAQCADSKNAERNWSAAMRIATQLGSPKETLEKNARSLLELASNLRQVPQNARRPNV